MLEDKIYNDYVQALKSREKDKSVFLSLLRSEFKNQAIELKKDKLSDPEALTVLKKQQKRLLDAKESIIASKRTDLIEGLESELKILSSYLPEPLSDSKVLEIIDEIISSTGACSIKDMGKVMKEVLAKVGVSADSKKVSSLVKEKLTSK